jgi:hypothetical protein
MTSVAVLGLEVRSEQVSKADRALDGLTASAGQAEKATGRLAIAQDNLENEARQTTQAVKAQVGAQKMLAATSGAAAFRQRQLAVQSLDVAQSLALGMPPMMVAVQQGGQIAGLYAGQGGVAGAFKEATASVLGFARAHPIAIAATIALGAAAFGLKNEVEALSGASVTWGQLATATFSEIAASLSGVVAPAMTALGVTWQGVSNFMLDALKLVGNSFINTFSAIYVGVRGIFSQFPAVIGDAMFAAAQKAIDAYNWLASKVPGMGAIDDIENTYAGTVSGIGADMGAQFQNDHIGDFIGRVANRATGLATAADAAASSVGKIGTAAAQAKTPMDLLGDSMQSASDTTDFMKSTISGFASSMRGALRSGADAWGAFEDAAVQALDKITDRILNQLLDALFQVNNSGGGGFLSAIFGGIGGGAAGGLHMGGIGGAFGGFFADGGTLGAGKWGIAGERGPEIIRGPATVQPTGGSSVNMNVTINNPTHDSIPGIKRALSETRAELMSFQKNAAAVVSGQRRLNPGLA